MFQSFVFLWFVGFGGLVAFCGLGAAADASGCGSSRVCSVPGLLFGFQLEGGCCPRGCLERLMH